MVGEESQCLTWKWIEVKSIQSQLTFLQNEKCDEMQGFYFSKPLATSQLSGLFLMT